MLFVSFTVDKNGKISNTKMKDMNPDNIDDLPLPIKAEANRLLKIMPKWSNNRPQGRVTLGGFKVVVKAK